MAEEDLIPQWAKELVEAIAATLEFEAPASLDCQLSAPDETEWGVDMVELWPAVMEIQEAGPNDGEIVYGVVRHMNLLAIQKLFDEVGAFLLEFENDGQPSIVIEGKFKERAVIVLIYFDPPFENEEGTE
ncbi:MAG: hypothetical protein ACM3PS_08870 [Syntrophothermus sp.]|jgi:hypothetical protein